MGYHSFETSGRLHPCGKVGVSLARTSASSTTAMLWSASRCAWTIASGLENVMEPSTRSQISRARGQEHVGVRAQLLELFGRVRGVGLRQHPVRRALEQDQLVDTRRDLGDELHRARRAADHRDALAGEVVVVVPTRRVEHGARELVEPGMSGHAGFAEHAHGADHARRTRAPHRRSVVRCQTARSSSHRTAVTPALSRRCGARPYFVDAVLEVGAGSRAGCRTGATSRA